MGIVKQLMMEHDEHEWENAPVSFTCPQCGQFSDGEAELPKIVDDYTYELKIDVGVECTACGADFSGEFQKDATECKIVFDDYPDTKVECEPACYESQFDDEWYDEPYFYDRPDRPFAHFKEAYSELKAAIDIHAVENGQSSMNRMFFTQSFSIFEAYLCDVFLNLVFSRVEHQVIFLKGYKDTKEFSLSLEELIPHREEAASEIIRKKLTQIIKKNLFHNLNKVKAMFKLYGVDFLGDEADRELLLKAVEYRHHAVHRNGHDLEGSKLEVYTKAYILEITSKMMIVARILDDNVTKKEL